MKKESQFMFEIFLPKEMLEQMTQGYSLNDKEAEVLYKLWKDAAPGVKTYKASQSDSDTVTSLKAKGYLSGSSDLEFTDKGKKILREMVTCEPNSFDKNSKSLSYSGIKNKSAKRQRQTFTKHSDSKDKVEPFNLHKESLKKMRGE